MGVGVGMANAWIRAIREGYKARQTMSHLSKKRWNHMGKRLYQNQHGSGLIGGIIPLVGTYILKKLIKKKQTGSGKPKKRKRLKRCKTSIH